MNSSMNSNDMDNTNSNDVDKTNINDVDNTDITVINKINKKISTVTVDDIAEYCADAGITVSRLCLKLNNLLDAKKVKFDKWGDEVAEEDNVTQLKTVSTCLELLKLVGIKTGDVVVGKVEHQMAPGDIERLEVISKELIGLEQRRLADPIQRGGVIDTEAVV